MTTFPIVLRAPDGSSVRIDRFPVILGRSHAGSPVQPDCDLSPFDREARVSRQHARIEWHEGRLYVVDMASTNGTQLNGQPLPPNQPIEIGPRGMVILGGLAISVEVEGLAAAPPPQAPAPVGPPPGAMGPPPGALPPPPGAMGPPPGAFPPPPGAMGPPPGAMAPPPGAFPPPPGAMGPPPGAMAPPPGAFPPPPGAMGPPPGAFPPPPGAMGPPPGAFPPPPDAMAPPPPVGAPTRPDLPSLGGQSQGVVPLPPFPSEPPSESVPLRPLGAPPPPPPSADLPPAAAEEAPDLAPGVLDELAAPAGTPEPDGAPEADGASEAGRLAGEPQGAPLGSAPPTEEPRGSEPPGGGSPFAPSPPPLGAAGGVGVPFPPPGVLAPPPPPPGAMPPPPGTMPPPPPPPGMAPATMPPPAMPPQAMAPAAPPQAGPPLGDRPGTLLFALSDPHALEVQAEAGRTPLVRTAQGWAPIGDGPLTPSEWSKFWSGYAKRTGTDQGASGYVTRLLDNAVSVEAVLPPMAAEPSFTARRLPPPRRLDDIVGAEGAALVREALAGQRGVLVLGEPRGGLTAVLEAIVDAIPSGGRIAIVELRPQIRHSAASVLRLRSQGVQGVAAVDLAATTSPDWVVIDEALPEAAGIAAWRHGAGGPAPIMAARAPNPAAWRDRAAGSLAATAGSPEAAARAISETFSVTVTVTPAGTPGEYAATAGRS